MPTGNQNNKSPSRLSPLWVISLFVSLTEATLGVAATQTTGGVQITLTVFSVVFPVLIASAFFAILWWRPYSFYPPSEYGKQTTVDEYVSAMLGGSKKLIRTTSDLTEEKIETYGDPDRLVLLFKAKGKSWVRSTKAMQVKNGCILQFSTGLLTPDGAWRAAEAATFVPNVIIKDEENGEGKYLAEKVDA